jgi:small subunit ribosomal protein S16
MTDSESQSPNHRVASRLRDLFILLDVSARFDIMDSMLAIKLQRIGKKHQPSYRVVVAEKRSKMAAPPVEDLGSYNPFTKLANVKKERVLHWVKMGAQPTTTAHNLLVGQGVIVGATRVVKMPKAVAKTVEAPAPKAAVAEAEPVAEASSEEPAANIQ